jgi:recombination protein RecA
LNEGENAMAKADKEKTASKLDSKENVGREEALAVAMTQIERQFGKGAIMKLGDAAKMRVAFTSTGALTLDLALGIGGLPKGRVIEIYGPESGGKTTVALHSVAECQKAGGTAAFVDAEHALDPAYAKALGVDIDNLWVSQPDSGEQALEITEALVRSSAVDLVVIDSVAALVPKAEIEGEMGDSHVGLQARLMSQALRKLTAAIGKSQCTVIFINQVREKIGVMYGNPETTTGGRALRFYASVRMEVRRIETIKKDGGELGNRVKVKIVKNKIAPPFRVAEFDILFGKGINRMGCVLDVAVEHGIIQKSGSWFAYCEQKIGQGRDNAYGYMEQHPDMAKEVESLVRQKIALMQQEQSGQLTEVAAPEDLEDEAALLAEEG